MWERLWAFGRYDLGLSEVDFWALTPREFILIAERARARIRWSDYRAAITPWIVSCAVAGKKAPDLDEFTVSKMFRRGAEAAKLKNDPEKRQKNLFQKAMAAFGAVGAINAKRGE